jgi:hypothetical protein
MKEGSFIGSQTRQLFENQDFSTELNSTERRAWKAFENICRNFLGNKKVESYSEIEQELISLYHAMVGNMSLKLNFLRYIRIFFLENMGSVSYEHGKRDWDISQTGKRYIEKWSPNMLADYYWHLIRATPTGERKIQKKKK